MKILKNLILISVLTTALFAISKDEIKPVMEQKVATAVSILKNTNLNKDDKPLKIFNLFDEYFDYPFMAKLSLSNAYKSLSSKEQNEFSKTYEAKLKESFVDKLKSYTDQDMKIVDLVYPSQNRAVLKTIIIGKDKNYNIDFKFYPKSANEWRVYDVDVLGVSIIATYRSQFADLSKSADFNTILERLKKSEAIKD